MSASQMTQEHYDLIRECLETGGKVRTTPLPGSQNACQLLRRHPDLKESGPIMQEFKKRIHAATGSSDMNLCFVDKTEHPEGAKPECVRILKSMLGKQGGSPGTIVALAVAAGVIGFLAYRGSK